MFMNGAKNSNFVTILKTKDEFLIIQVSPLVPIPIRVIMLIRFIKGFLKLLV